MSEWRPCPRCQGSGRIADDRAVGTRMRERREAKKITLRAMARRLNLSVAYLSDLELGRRRWSHTNVTRYADVFGKI